MKKALELIVSSLVEKDKDVSIDEQEQNGIVNFTITVNKDDMGKIIGKSGRIIKAIRSVMKIPAIKSGKKIYVNLSENPQG